MLLIIRPLMVYIHRTKTAYIKEIPIILNNARVYSSNKKALVGYRPPPEGHFQKFWIFVYLEYGSDRSQNSIFFFSFAQVLPT